MAYYFIRAKIAEVVLDNAIQISYATTAIEEANEEM